MTDLMTRTDTPPTVIDGELVEVRGRNPHIVHVYGSALTMGAAGLATAFAVLRDDPYAHISAALFFLTILLFTYCTRQHIDGRTR